MSKNQKYFLQVRGTRKHDCAITAQAFFVNDDMSLDDYAIYQPASAVTVTLESIDITLDDIVIKSESITKSAVVFALDDKKVTYERKTDSKEYQNKSAKNKQFFEQMTRSDFCSCVKFALTEFDTVLKSARTSSASTPAATVASAFEQALINAYKELNMSESEINQKLDEHRAKARETAQKDRELKARAKAQARKNAKLKNDANAVDADTIVSLDAQSAPAPASETR